jgi:endonuclease YncB( thermonuclease family)
MRVLALLCASAISFCGPISPHADPLVTVPRIVDADTVDAGTVKIRLNGIDAPETDQRCLDAHGQVWGCGVEASAKLQAYSRERPWSCELTGTDRYGRFLGTCSVDGEDIDRWLVRNGWALAFRRYSSVYVPDEDYAREHQLGLWSGAFIAPWD